MAATRLPRRERNSTFSIPVDGAYHRLAVGLVHEQLSHYLAEPPVRRIVVQTPMPELIDVIRRNVERKLDEADPTRLGKKSPQLLRQNRNQIAVCQNRPQPDKAGYAKFNLTADMLRLDDLLHNRVACARCGYRDMRLSFKLS